MKKRIIAILSVLLILSLLSFTGCKNQSNASNTLTCACSSDIDNFDPFTSQTMQFMNTVNFNCYECLMHLNSNMEYEMDLATSYEQIDSVTYVFNLREGVKFHNGESFTAQDVIYTIETIQDESVGAWRASQYENVQSVESDGDYKVVITLKSVQPAFLDNIAYTAIVSKSTTPKELQSKPIGTGAFKFVSWTPNDNITFEKYDDYWDADKINFDKFIYKCIPDNQVALANLKAGSVQIISMVSTEVAKTIESTEGLTVYKSAYANHVYEWEIGRHNNKALADPQVVKAMFLCLDRDTIANSVFNGMVSKSSSPFPSSAKYYASVDDCEYNVEKAREILKNTDYADGFSFKATIVGSTGEQYETLVIWQDSLKQIGIDLQIEVVDSSVWLDKYLARSYDLICNDYSMVGTDPATYCNVLLGALSEYQTSDLEELNRLINEAATSNDEELRTQDYKKIQEILVEYRPVTSYVEAPSLSGAASNLKGVVINGMGHCFLKGAYLEK